MQKIFWRMGMWSRINVPIVVYEDNGDRNGTKKHDVTDIDVYGVMYKNDFENDCIIADCKAGKNVKIFERLFWVRGVKEYYGAKKAYLVKKSISSNAKLLLPKLDIIGVDTSTLKELTKIYHTDKLKIFGRDYYKKIQELVQSYTKEYEKIYQYLSTRYWYTDANVCMNVIFTMLEKRNFYKQLDKNNLAHRYLVMEICILFAKTLLECCRYVLSRDLLDIEKSILEFIHGGVENFNSKMGMVREIRIGLGDMLNIDDISNSVLVQPQYFNALSKIIATLIGEAINTKDILRYMEIMQHEIVLEKKFDFSDCLENEYSLVTHKLAKDIMLFYLDYSKLDHDFFGELLYE